MDKIAIIGAGLAGLTAADALLRAGCAVTVFDKSRGLGGRLATRRTDSAAFDHGAPWAHGDADFDVAMAGIGAQRSDRGWRGTPGMSALAKPLLGDAVRMAGTRIIGIDHANGWRLRDESGDEHGRFEGLIVAIPALQLTEIVPDAPLGPARMSARWTLMTVWPGFEVPEASGPFEQIIDQSGRAGAVPGTVVAHASADWTAACLEHGASEVAARLVTELAALGGRRDAPHHAQAHRWRYARTDTPLGAAFVEIGPRAVAGGDWALGDLAGDAWRSGRAMADAVARR